MEKYSKQLRFISWIYIAFAVLCLLVIAGSYMLPGEITDAIKGAYETTSLQGINPTTLIAVTLGFQVILYIIYFFLLRRIANKKSRGTFVMVLLIASIVLTLIGMLRKFEVSNIFGLALNCYVLYLIFQIRKIEE